MPQVRPILVHADTVLVDIVVRVTANVVALVNYQHFVTSFRQSARDRCAGKTSANN